MTPKALALPFSNRYDRPGTRGAGDIQIRPVTPVLVTTVARNLGRARAQEAIRVSFSRPTLGSCSGPEHRPHRVIHGRHHVRGREPASERPCRAGCAQAEAVPDAHPDARPDRRRQPRRRRPTPKPDRLLRRSRPKSAGRQRCLVPSAVTRATCSRSTCSSERRQPAPDPRRGRLRQPAVARTATAMTRACPRATHHRGGDTQRGRLHDQRRLIELGALCATLANFDSGETANVQFIVNAAELAWRDRTRGRRSRSPRRSRPGRQPQHGLRGAPRSWSARRTPTRMRPTRPLGRCSLSTAGQYAGQEGLDDHDCQGSRRRGRRDQHLRGRLRRLMQRRPDRDRRTSATGRLQTPYLRMDAQWSSVSIDGDQQARLDQPRTAPSSRYLGVMQCTTPDT